MTDTTPETLATAIATTVPEYTSTAQGLAELATRYKSVVYPVATSAGLAEAIKARAEIRTIRVDLEKTRKQIKEPALARCREIDAEASRLKAALELLEEPIDEQIKAEERRRAEHKAEVERQERERLAAIGARIEGIRIYPLNFIGAKPATLEVAIATLAEKPEILEGFGEAHLADATAARDEALERLRQMLASAQEAEQAAQEAARQAEERRQAQELEEQRLAADRAELERLRAEQAERERITRESFEASQAAAQAEREEADRLAAEQRAREDEEARLEREAQQRELDRQAAEQAEAQRLLDDQAEEQRQREEAARLRQEREEAERLEAELAAAEKLAEEQAAAQRAQEEREIAVATLRGSATEAVALLIELGQEQHLTTRKLAAALGATIEGQA